MEAVGREKLRNIDHHSIKIYGCGNVLFILYPYCFLVENVP
jgi:hypothetical protein